MVDVKTLNKLSLKPFHKLNNGTESFFEFSYNIKGTTENVHKFRTTVSYGLISVALYTLVLTLYQMCCSR